MNIDHIKTFLEVAATGNFNRAAERLHITQSTVSARIRALETRLDRPLFLRAHDGVELTATGRRFQRHALGVVQAWERGRQEAGLPLGFRAVLGLGVQINLQHLLLAWSGRLRRQAPDVALRLEADFSPSLMQQLVAGFLDVGVLYVPYHAPGLVVESFLEERLVLVSTRPRALEEGWREDYIFIHWGEDVVAAHQRAFPDLDTPAVSFGLGTPALEWLLARGGSGYFPLQMVAPLLASGRLHRIDGAPQFQRPAYLVYQARPADPALQELALEGVRRTAREEPFEGP